MSQASGTAGGSAGETAGSAGSGESGGDSSLDQASFEELMAQLEEVTSQLAAGDIGIEAAVELYERAERLHAAATARLAQVRKRVEKLTGNID